MHALKPFPDAHVEAWADYSLLGAIAKNNKTLEVEFQLQGSIDELVWPELATPRLRQDNLWETTCLEFFFSEPGAVSYWEVNLSPCGHWNLYGFDDYRQGMRTETAIAALDIDSALTVDSARLTCSVPIEALSLKSDRLEVSLTAVLALKSGAISYWALDRKSVV